MTDIQYLGVPSMEEYPEKLLDWDQTPDSSVSPGGIGPSAIFTSGTEAPSCPGAPQLGGPRRRLPGGAPGERRRLRPRHRRGRFPHRGTYRVTQRYDYDHDGDPLTAEGLEGTYDEAAEASPLSPPVSHRRLDLPAEAALAVDPDAAFAYNTKQVGCRTRQTFIMTLKNNGPADLHGLWLDVSAGPTASGAATAENHFEVLKQPAAYLPAGVVSTVTVQVDREELGGGDVAGGTELPDLKRAPNDYAEGHRWVWIHAQSTR